MQNAERQPTKVANWDDLPDLSPKYALIEGVDLVVIRLGDDISVLYGRCLHRGALMSDAEVVGDNLICGVHGWDYRVDTGVSEYNNAEALKKFSAWVEDDVVWVDGREISKWARTHPQPYKRDEYQGLYQDPHGTPEEPHVSLIQSLAKDGFEITGHHGPSAAMGVPRQDHPTWDDLQILSSPQTQRTCNRGGSDGQ